MNQRDEEDYHRQRHSRSAEQSCVMSSVCRFPSPKYKYVQYHKKLGKIQYMSRARDQRVTVQIYLVGSQFAISVGDGSACRYGMSHVANRCFEQIISHTSMLLCGGDYPVQKFGDMVRCIPNKTRSHSHQAVCLKEQLVHEELHSVV